MFTTQHSSQGVQDAKQQPDSDGQIVLSVASLTSLCFMQPPYRDDFSARCGGRPISPALLPDRVRSLCHELASESGCTPESALFAMMTAAAGALDLVWPSFVLLRRILIVLHILINETRVYKCISCL